MRGFKGLTLTVLITAAWLCVLAACGGGGGEAPPSPDVSEPRDEGEPLISIAGIELAHGEVVYLIMRAVSEYSYDRVVDWDGMINGLPAQRFFLNRALDLAVTAHVTSIKAAELGYTLTGEEDDLIDLYIAWETSEAGGPEAFSKGLADSGLTEELYRFYIYTVPLLYEKMLEDLFLAGGRYMPDDAAMRAYYDRNYIPVCYIFLSAVDDYGERLTGAELDLQRSVAEALRRLAVGGEDFFALIGEHGQDYMMAHNPEGMPIPLGQIGGVFDSVLLRLAEGEISDVVTADEGFYIIKRLPEDPVWFDLNKDELLYVCGMDAFLSMIGQWSREMTITQSKAFWEIDVLDVISVG
jgi:hypothetical protein